MIHTRTPRIGIIGMGHFEYWSQFEGLKEQLMRKQTALHGYFSDAVQTVDIGYADDIDSAFTALKQAQKEDLDALFIVMSTYVTSQVIFPFARYLHIPQVLVAIQPMERLDYAHTTTRMQLENDDICSLPEFTGVYARLGAPKPFLLIASSGETQKISERIRTLERAICAAAAFKYAKFGYMGHTYDGMYDMNTDPTAFSSTFGAHVSMIEFSELITQINSVDPASIRQKTEEIRSVFDICQPSEDPLTDFVGEDDLLLAARCAVGLDRLVDERGLSALAYFYRGGRGSEEEQLAANLIIGNSLLTSRGIPLAGEADLKTAAAMLIMHRVGGGGSFAELHPFDSTDDLVLIGHDGPHNLAISDAAPIMRKLKKFHGKPGQGVSVEFKLKTGPVTLLSCGVDENRQLHLISACGESVPGMIPQTGNTNTKCRFAYPVTEFIERWCNAAPTHHLALGIGDHTEEIRLFARMMGLRLTEI